MAICSPFERIRPLPKRIEIRVYRNGHSCLCNNILSSFFLRPLPNNYSEQVIAHLSRTCIHTGTTSTGLRVPRVGNPRLSHQARPVAAAAAAPRAPRAAGCCAAGEASTPSMSPSPSGAAAASSGAARCTATRAPPPAPSTRASERQCGGEGEHPAPLQDGGR